MKPNSFWVVGLAGLCLLQGSSHAADEVKAAEAAKSVGGSSRLVKNVPSLGWGKDRESTFFGALEAALAPTDHPYDYVALMGASGVAFRVRWYQGTGDNRWNPASPDEVEKEELARLRKATGWGLNYFTASGDDEQKRQRLVKEIHSSLEAGKALVSLTASRGDHSVVYGYEEKDKSFLVRDYNATDGPVRLTADKLGFFAVTLGERGNAVSSRDAFIVGLKATVRNWNRGSMLNDKGKCWYGDAAFARWTEDLDKADSLKEKEKQQLFFVSWWNLDCLFDARTAGVKYLRANADLLKPEAKAAVERAIDLYGQEIQPLTITFTERDVFLGPWTGKTLADWTPEVRTREKRILEKARKFEGQAVAEIEKALIAEGVETKDLRSPSGKTPVEWSD